MYKPYTGWIPPRFGATGIAMVDGRNDGIFVFQTETEDSLGLITSKETTINTFVFEKKMCDKVVKFLVRTDNDVEYESGTNLAPITLQQYSRESKCQYTILQYTRDPKMHVSIQTVNSWIHQYTAQYSQYSQ
jgi:hypothetical protein